MKKIDESEQYLLSKGITEDELVLCGNYIKIYVRELCFEHSIYITNKELNKSCKCLSRALMDLIIGFEETANQNVKKQIGDIIEDFQTVDEKALGNLIALLNKAKRHEETNTRIISELYAVFLPEDFDMSEPSDFMN